MTSAQDVSRPKPMGALEVIAARRSCSRLFGPPPSEVDLAALVAAAEAAPDHGRLRPWRFHTLSGSVKDDFGAVLAEAYLRRCADAGTAPAQTSLDKERTKLGRAPLVVVAACVPVASSVPEIEQVLAVGAAVQNLLLAATELGYGSMWRTGDAAYDPQVKAALGLAATDHIIGFIYLGTVAAT